MFITQVSATPRNYKATCNKHVMGTNDMILI